MKYAQVINGRIVKGPCKLPKRFQTSEGDIITNFDLLSSESLKIHGWYPVLYEDLREYQIYIDPVLQDGSIVFQAVDKDTTAIVQHNENIAKITRDAAEEAIITVHGVDWQVKEVDRVRMKETIDTATRLEYPEETEIPWILADNTVRSTTKADLCAVLDMFSVRRQDIFTQYRAWRAGEKLNPFEYIPS